MNRVVTSRVSMLMTAAVVVVIAACSDTSNSRTGLTGPSANSSGGSPGDSAGNHPGNPGGGHSDTSVTPTPAPKPVASFTLAVHVGSPRPGAADTLATDPVVGAAVSVYERTITFVNNPGADTANINQTLVASGSSDAAGNFSVPNLKGTAEYLIKVAPPAGSAFGPSSVFFNQAYLDVVNVLVTLRGK